MITYITTDRLNRCPKILFRIVTFSFQKCFWKFRLPFWSSPVLSTISLRVCWCTNIPVPGHSDNFSNWHVSSKNALPWHGYSIILETGLFNMRVVIWDTVIFLSWKQISPTTAGVCRSEIIACNRTHQAWRDIYHMFTLMRENDKETIFIWVSLAKMLYTNSPLVARWCI